MRVSLYDLRPFGTIFGTWLAQTWLGGRWFVGGGMKEAFGSGSVSAQAAGTQTIITITS